MKRMITNLNSQQVILRRKSVKQTINHITTVNVICVMYDLTIKMYPKIELVKPHGNHLILQEVKFINWNLNQKNPAKKTVQHKIV